MATKRKELTELQALASSPAFWNDNLKAKGVIEKTNKIKATLDPYDHIVREAEESGLLLELAAGEPEGAARQGVMQEAVEKIKKPAKGNRHRSVWIVPAAISLAVRAPRGISIIVPTRYLIFCPVSF